MRNKILALVKYKILCMPKAKFYFLLLRTKVQSYENLTTLILVVKSTS